MSAAIGHRTAISSEHAARKALESMHGWNNNPVSSKTKTKTSKPNMNAKSPLRKSPSKIDKDHYPMSPNMPGARKVKRDAPLPIALPAGTRLNVWWAGEDEPFECEVSEWRLISNENADQPPTYLHRCEYEGGAIDHSLDQIVFEVVPGTLHLTAAEEATGVDGRDTLTPSEDLPPPTSPLKGNVLARGKTAVWQKPEEGTPERKTSEQLEMEQLELLQKSLNKPESEVLQKL